MASAVDVCRQTLVELPLPFHRTVRIPASIDGQPLSHLPILSTVVGRLSRFPLALDQIEEVRLRSTRSLQDAPNRLPIALELRSPICPRGHPASQLLSSEASVTIALESELEWFGSNPTQPALVMH